MEYRKLFPNPSDESALKKEDFISSAKTVYAAAVWIRVKENKRSGEPYEIPSVLLETSEELIVRDGVIDTSQLKALTSLPDELWLQGVIGDCYMKTSFNLWKTLKDDDSQPDSIKPYYPLGKKVVFPLGANSPKLSIVYAKLGSTIDGDVEVEGSLGQIIRDKLAEMYGGKIGKEDKTNNSNPND